MKELYITPSLLLNVRDLCKRKGLQLRDVATLMNMAPESLSRALHGNPTLSTLCSLANALGVPVSRLLAQGGDRASEDLLGVISFGNGQTRVVKDLEDLEIVIKQLKK
jgi:transcriptional regulator with XRE-family HTH domain